MRQANSGTQCPHCGGKRTHTTRMTVKGHAHMQAHLSQCCIAAAIKHGVPLPKSAFGRTVDWFNKNVKPKLGGQA